MWRVMFKVEPSLWEMMAQGKKNWDARLVSADPRIQRLLNTTATETLQICYWDKGSHHVLLFEMKANYRLPFAPGWLFMELVPRPDLYTPGAPVSFMATPWKVVTDNVVTDNVVTDNVLTSNVTDKVAAPEKRGAWVYYLKNTGKPELDGKGPFYSTLAALDALGVPQEGRGKFWHRHDRLPKKYADQIEKRPRG